MFLLTAGRKLASDTRTAYTSGGSESKSKEPFSTVDQAVKTVIEEDVGAHLRDAGGVDDDAHDAPAQLL